MPGTHLLPPNLLKLFAPRPPLIYLRPVGRDPDRIRKKPVTGIADLLSRLNEERTQNMIDAGNQETPEGMEEGEEPVFTLAEETRRQIRREERKKAREEKFRIAKEAYKPTEDAEAIGDPYKTLFVARLKKEAKENDVRREFEGYGPIERVRVVRDKQNRSRGYAFIVYERERDMKAAYKEADGIFILGKRIKVDVERGRTVKGWRPRRLGGGIGGRPKPEVVAAAAPVRSNDAPRSGGFRGGGGSRFGGPGRNGFGGGGGFGGGRGGGGGYGERDRGYGGRGRGGGFGGGNFGQSDDGYGSRGGYGGGGGGGGFRGRGAGVGFGGGFANGDFNGGPPSGPGGYGGGFKREGGGYDDRDTKRMRY